MPSHIAKRSWLDPHFVPRTKLQGLGIPLALGSGWFPWWNPLLVEPLVFFGDFSLKKNNSEYEMLISSQA